MEVEPALSVVYSRVLMRVRAERDQAFAVRVREMFIDMRLLWPALGATMAVLVCLSVALGVLEEHVKRAAGIAGDETRGDEPGLGGQSAESRQQRARRSLLRQVTSTATGLVGSRSRGSWTMAPSVAGIRDEEAMFTMAMVVNREGRITNAEMLKSERSGAKAEQPVHSAGHRGRARCASGSRDSLRPRRPLAARSPSTWCG